MSANRGHNVERLRVRGQDSLVEVDMTPPDTLLKVASERAVKLANRNKPDEAVLQYVKVLALTRIVFGDDHWRVPEAYVSLARAYLELRGENFFSERKKNRSAKIFKNPSQEIFEVSQVSDKILQTFNKPFLCQKQIKT